ncbi:hypothetical protein BJ165DRAFT_1593796 [Panaeolus papilionaceus]|nr:hypothetical protein BJ165DRAFT_1593796 [Panaeolus papilionaceus]
MAVSVLLFAIMHIRFPDASLRSESKGILRMSSIQNNSLNFHQNEVTYFVITAARFVAAQKREQTLAAAHSLNAVKTLRFAVNYMTYNKLSQAKKAATQVGIDHTLRITEWIAESRRLVVLFLGHVERRQQEDRIESNLQEHRASFLLSINIKGTAPSGLDSGLMTIREFHGFPACV